MAICVGDEVMYTKENERHIPCGFGHSPHFIVQCVDERIDSVFLLPDDGRPEGDKQGADCNCGGGHSWIARPCTLKVVRKASKRAVTDTELSLYGKKVWVTSDSIRSVWGDFAVKYTGSWKDFTKTTKPKMSLIQKFKQLVMTEPQKTFSKFGIVDGEGDLTQEGRVLFTQFLLSKFGAEFKADVLDKMEVPKTE